MFFNFPVQAMPNLRQTVFILNTILLIGILIVVELVYSETPKENRKHLILFFPLFLVLVGILIYAAVLQGQGV